MKSKVKGFIHIPNACPEEWELMPADGQGRHCNQCNNRVYDFSQMSDDQLLNFLRQNEGVHCGRFHPFQLRRDILASPKKRNFRVNSFSKITAAFFTVLSFKNINSHATVQHNGILTVDDASFRNKAQTSSDTIIISGTVKDNEGNPLGDAAVLFDSVKVATTDKEGRFSFKPGALVLTNHNLYFSWGDMVTAVRSYHPGMFSTQYNVELYKKGSGGYHIAGIFLPADLFVSPPVIFKANSWTLTTRAKKLLSDVATEMKNNPSVKIALNAYPPVCGKQYISAKQADEIKKYLAEIEGIAPERISINCEVDGGQRNVVEIRAEY
jgi:outer membrane protein OmpA-like peptidoglycan-associated protein